MSKNRNQQQQQQRPAVQQQATQTATQQEQPTQGQEEQAQQEQASQDTTTVQQANDQPAVEQKDEAVQEPVQQKEEVVSAPAPVVKTQQEGFTPVYKVQLDLAGYAEAMDNKKSIVPEEGGKWQYSLFNTLKSVLNAKTQDDFNKEWNTALVFFHQNKEGVFNENWMFRFGEYWPGSQTEFTLFRRIVYMMIQTANPKTRKAELKSINMGLVVEGLKEDQKTKLLNFYEV